MAFLEISVLPPKVTLSTVWTALRHTNRNMLSLSSKGIKNVQSVVTGPKEERGENGENHPSSVPPTDKVWLSMNFQR